MTWIEYGVGLRITKCVLCTKIVHSLFLSDCTYVTSDFRGVGLRRSHCNYIIVLFLFQKVLKNKVKHCVTKWPGVMACIRPVDC